VIIVGGGFGGLYAARALRRAPVAVRLLDRRNHHLFQPLLYQVATAALSPADIAGPIRNILRKQRNTEVFLALVTDVDVADRHVVLGDGRRFGYDYLILATGAVDHYFGHGEWEVAAPGLKTIDDAIDIRRRFLLAFEAAEQASDPGLRDALLTFVVVGGGPTGVEMAGAFAEIARHTLANDFRHIDPRRARVVLVEGGPRLLATYDESLSEKAKGKLERIGVEVRLGSMVTGIAPDAVEIGEERIPARNIVWAAGVAASPLGAALGVETDRLGRVLVEPDLSVPGHPELFVIGDLAAFTHQTGEPLPGVAPVAMQMARTAARNIRNSLEGRPREEFRYRDRGSMATIGRAAAVAQVGSIRIAGFAAWLAWLFIHLMYLAGFRNRVIVFLEWAWSYLSWQRGARLITGEIGPDLAPAGSVLGAPPEEGGWLEGDASHGDVGPSREDVPVPRPVPGDGGQPVRPEGNP
jgi:NADH:ubiquinone reductase (H+-translocating)